MYSLPPYFAACYSILLPSLLPPPSSFILFLFFYFPSPPPLDCCCLPPSFFLPPLLFPPRSSLLLYYAFPLLSSPLIGGEGGRGSILLVYLNTWCLRSYLPLPSLVLPPLLPLSPSPSRIPSPLPCASTCSYSCSSTSLFPFFLSLSFPPFSLFPFPSLVWFLTPFSSIMEYPVLSSRKSISLSLPPPCTHSTAIITYLLATTKWKN